MDKYIWEKANEIYQISGCNVAATLSVRRTVNGSVKSDFDVDLAYRKFINMISRKMFGRNKGTLKNICFREYGCSKGLHLHAMLEIPMTRFSCFNDLSSFLEEIWCKQSVAYTHTKKIMVDCGKISYIKNGARDFHVEEIFDDKGWLNYCCKNNFNIDNVINVAASFR